MPAATQITIELWALITFLVGLLLSFIGCVFAFAKVLGGQVDRRLTERFKAQEDARLVADQALHDILKKHLEEEKKTAQKIVDLERDFLNWKGDLPLNYVRREDYIRGQQVMEAKQDSLFAETKMVLMKLEQIRGRMGGME